MSDAPPPLPPLASVPQPPIQVPGSEGVAVTVDNRTTLPDAEIMEAVRAYWVESAALQFGNPTSFQLYASNGSNSMLNRSPFRVPRNVIEEIGWRGRWRTPTTT
jgi:signal transduction histidine kinase